MQKINTSPSKRFLLPFLFFCISPAASQALDLSIVYPREGSRIGPVKSSFVFGSVSPATATLSINGSTVPVYRTGAFLAMIPFTPSDFKIKATAESDLEKVTLTRNVYVSPASYPPLSAMPLTIAQDTIEPSAPMILRQGDIVSMRFKGSHSCKAEFRLKLPHSEKKPQWFPMPERTPGSGIYESLFSIPNLPETVEDARIEFRLTGKKEKSVKATSKSRIRILKEEFFAQVETVSDDTILRTGPSAAGEQMGYDLFLPKGIVMKATGKIGNEIRVKLSDTYSAWTDEKNFSFQPSPAPLPNVIVEALRVKNKERSASVSIDMRRGVPYRAGLSDDLKTFTLTLYGAISNLDRFRTDPEDPNNWLEQVRWSQTARDTFVLRFEMKEKIWGYDVRFDGTKLVCEILRAPKSASEKRSLKDLVVALDPGHSPEITDGTISPHAVQEGTVNYRIAEKVKERLEKEGAKVILTRLESEAVALPDRGRRAYEAGAQVFISIHANALPDGQNPYDRRGFSVYYFQPFSLDLAQAVHEAYAKNIKTADDGFYYGNLAVCRVTQMPAILTESGYLIRPDEEELLLDPAFQSKIADSISEGLTKFVQNLKK